MRVKSKYKSIPVENTPAEINSPVTAAITAPPEAPAVAVAVEAQSQPDNLEAVAKVELEAARADDAALALKRQLDAIRQSEELQRQQQIAQNAPTTREGKLALWKSQGASDAELRFLEANPELVDIPQLTAFAANEASKHGHERGSEAHMQATKNIFHEYLAKQEPAAAKPAQQTPEFFRPPPQKAPSPRSTANIVSAPVSREVPSGGYREPNLNQVKLSPEEVEIAQASGISQVEYAKHKLRLMREKASGQRQ